MTSISTNKETMILEYSFIIPTLNEASMLEKLLRSIKALSTSSKCYIHEIIVVDANSTDSTVEIAKRYNCLIVNTTRGRVSRSRNLGAKQASGNVFAFVDADCELPSSWLINTASALGSQNTVAVGSSMAKRGGSNWVENTWYELAHRNLGSDLLVEADWLATFNVAVKSDAFKQTDGFDESLETCEDVEFGYRLKDIGKLFRLEESGVIHHGESKSIGEFYKRESWRSRGALGILKSHWHHPKEVISFLLPGVISGTLAILVFSLFVTAYQLTTGDSILTSTLLGLTIGPALVGLLVARRKVKLPYFIPSMVLLSIYFLARLHGMVRPFTRVERSN